MKKLIILFIFLLILPIVNAQFDPELASNFVSEQSTSNIIEKSYQVLSLSFYDPTTADKIATEIKSAGDNCWPTSCQIKDTSLALMALHKRGEEIDTSWLFSKQKASTSGKWYLQIDTAKLGKCKIEYDDKETTINVNKGELSTSYCPIKSTKLDINSCIRPNLLNIPGKAITIDCSDLDSTPTISLLNQEGSSYYIIDKAIKTQKTTLYINNGYFETTENTLFANWFLSDINSNINSKIWLKKQYDKNSVVHNSLMYLVTSDDVYTSYLIDLQDTTIGSFGDTYNTAIATLALARSGKYNSVLESARDFLSNKQLTDGSVENNLLYTAITLYSYSITKPAEEPPITPTITPTLPPTEICVPDGICSYDYGENRDNCPEDCYCGDGICDNTESFIICPDDCEEEIECTDDYDCPSGYECIDDTCVSKEPIVPPVEKKTSAIWWILIILIILIILFVIYYTQFYKKPKPKKKPIYRPLLPKKAPARRMRLPVYKARRPTRKSKVEEELEKSLEEARKLLKK